MQRKIGTEVELGNTVSPFESIGVSSAIDRTASNYLDADDKVRNIRKLIEQVRTILTSQNTYLEL